MEIRRELARMFMQDKMDYLAFLLDEYEWERRWGDGKGGLEQIGRLINEEIDRWELDEMGEILLAAILLERNGLEAEAPESK